MKNKEHQMEVEFGKQHVGALEVTQIYIYIFIPPPTPFY